MAYTWGYIKRSALAKLDLEPSEANTMRLLNRFTVYANEVITQVCSAVKPKINYFTFTCTEDQFVNGKYSTELTNDDFISFGGGINTVTYKKFADTPFEKTVTETAYNDILTFSGYNTITVKIPGTYKIWYNARWIDFSKLEDNLADTTILNVPNDILDCIPSYIAAQCYGIDDEYKAAKYRNEFEILLSRIDNRTADNSGTFKIGGDW